MQYIDILLVEDNPADAELTIKALRQNQVLNKINHVTDGEEALDYIYRRGAYSNRAGGTFPRLIILDLKLPKVGGLEVLKTLKADPETQTIPIVVMTSSVEERDLMASYNFGANSYVVKPVDFKDFSKAVSELGLYWTLLNEVTDRS